MRLKAKDNMWVGYDIYTTTTCDKYKWIIGIVNIYIEGIMYLF